MSKQLFQKLLFHILYFDLIVCFNSVLWVNDHIALVNITLIIGIALSIIQKILDNKNQYNNYDSKTFFYAILGYIVFLIFVYINGYDERTKFIFGKWIIMPLFCLLFFILPRYSKSKIHFLLLTFFINLSCIDLYIFFKYYILIVVEEGKSLPSESWNNFIDFLDKFIMPFRFIHLYVSIINLFALIAACLIFKESKGKYRRIGIFIFMSIFVLMIFFLASRMQVLLLVFFGVSYLYKFQLSRVSFNNKILGFFILCSILLLCINFIPTTALKYQKLKEELGYYVNSNYEEILNGPDYRLRGYFHSFDAIAKSPLSGIGFKKIYELYGDNKWPLNQYLFFALAYGIPFAVIQFISLFISLIYLNKKSKFIFFTLFFYCCYFMYSCVETSLLHRDSFYFFSCWLYFSLYLNEID